MERRGAAEVVAIDILDPRRWDWPANSTEEVVAALAERKRGGAGFELAREALGSAVERRELSVYDLDPGEVGSFDFVYVGSLLLHLRDPVARAGGVRSVCAADAVIVDAIDLPRRSLSAPAGRDPRRPRAAVVVEAEPGGARAPGRGGRVRARGPPRRLYMPPGEGHPRRLRAPRLLLSAAGREELLDELARRPARR